MGNRNRHAFVSVCTDLAIHDCIWGAMIMEYVAHLNAQDVAWFVLWMVALIVAVLWRDYIKEKSK